MLGQQNNVSLYIALFIAELRAIERKSDFLQDVYLIWAGILGFSI
jgi:hypothetical protein